jgi:transcription elongation factor Elf1
MKRDINKSELGEDLYGNNAALTCPFCGKVFVVSGLLNKKGRECPKCQKSKGYVALDGSSGQIEWT